MKRCVCGRVIGQWGREAFEAGRKLAPVMTCVFFATFTPARAEVVYWDGSGSGWDAAANWSTASGAATPDPGAAPGSDNDVVFNISPVNTAQTVNLNGDQAAHSLTNSTTGTVTLLGGGTDRTLTLGAGGFARTGNAATIVGSPAAGQRVNLILSESQTWLNNSAGSDTVISNGVAAHATGDTTTTNVLTLNAANKGFVFAGNNNTAALTDGAGGRRLALVKNGSGAITLNSTNTYSGGTRLNAGKIIVAANNALGSGPLVLAGGTLQQNADALLTNALIAQADTTSFLLGNSSGALILSGNLSGSGNISVNAWVNYGSPQLAGDNSGFSGKFTVYDDFAMRLKFNASTAGSSNAWWELQATPDGSSLNFDGNGTIYFGALSGNGQIRNNKSGSPVIEVGGLNTNSTFGGEFNGASITLRKVGSGTLAMTAADAKYSGGTQINGGTLVFSNTAAFGSGAISFGGGTLKHGTTFTNDLSAKIANSTGAITIDPSGQTVTYATALAASNAGGLRKKGAGTLALSAQPAYTGATTVEAGTLSVKAAFTTAGSVSVSNNASLDVTGALACGNLALGDGATLSAAGAITVGVVTVGSGAAIQIAKSAAWPLTGTFEIMSYTSEGSSALSDANVSVSGISGNSEATLDFTTAGKVYLTITAEALVWNGVSGDDWLGAGKWIGENSGDAYTFTDYDSVLFTNAATAGTSTVAVATSDVTPTSATFDIGAGYGYTLAGAYGIAGATTALTKNGGGAVILANANSYAGATAVNAGELALGDGTVNGAIAAGSAVAVADGATFTVNSAGSTSQTVANALTGAGTLKKKGAGTLTLGGQTAFTSKINVEEGTLRFRPSANFTLASVITNSGAIEQATNAITVNTGTWLSGTGGTWAILPGAELKLGGESLSHFGGLTELRLSGGKIAKNEYDANVTILSNVRAVDGTTNILDGIEANFRLNGGLLGSGTITGYSWKRGIMLFGDNSGFSGTFNFQTGGGQYCSQGFWATNACGSNAVWNVNYSTASDRAGAVHSLRFDVGGTYRLGALNTVPGCWLYCRTGTDGVPAVYDTVLEVGHRNLDCALEGKFVKNRFSLNKVGAAKLSLGSGFDCPAGTLIGVYGGTLAVNCTLSNATVSASSGARIEGVGAITNAFAWNGGVTVSPGTNGVGTLTLLATPVPATGAKFVANVSSNGTCAALSVQGSLNLSEMTLEVADLSQLAETQSFVIATTAGGTVTGRFKTTNLPTGWVARNEGTSVRIIKVSLGTLFKVF